MRNILLFSALLCSSAVSALASVDSGLLALVPSNTKIIGSVDVTRARDSEFGQFLLAKVRSEDDHFEEMIQETGFDPRRDLQSVLFAASGPADSSQQPSFVILARGNFDPNRIKALITSKGGGTLQHYNGVDFIANSDQKSAIAFLEVGVAAMADLNTVKQVIDNRASPTVLDSGLQSTINTVGTANDAWFVSLVGGSFLANHASQSSQAKAFQGLVQASGGVKFGSNVQTSCDVVARSAQDATSLTDVIRFMASMVQMQRQNDPRAGILASALDGMTLQSSGTNVHFALTLPEKTLEQLADAGPLTNAH